jgi:hypothetical protein
MAAADKSDLIGAEEQGRKGGGLFGSSKTTLKDKTNLFSLGDRMDTLRLQDPGVILVHVAEDKDMRYQFEQLFRSLNLTMIDNASSEYLFIYEFFSKDPNTAADIAKTVFQQIFDTTEKTGLVRNHILDPEIALSTFAFALFRTLQSHTWNHLMILSASYYASGSTRNWLWNFNAATYLHWKVIPTRQTCCYGHDSNT